MSISAYDADKAWVKALIKIKIDWLCRVEKESAKFHQMGQWNIKDYNKTNENK